MVVGLRQTKHWGLLLDAVYRLDNTPFHTPERSAASRDTLRHGFRAGVGSAMAIGGAVWLICGVVATVPLLVAPNYAAVQQIVNLIPGQGS